MSLDVAQRRARYGGNIADQMHRLLAIADCAERLSVHLDKRSTRSGWFTTLVALKTEMKELIGRE